MSLRKFSLTSSIVGLSLDFGRVMNCTEILPLYIQHRNNLIGLMGGVMTSDEYFFYDLQGNKLPNDRLDD